MYDDDDMSSEDPAERVKAFFLAEETRRGRGDEACEFLAQNDGLGRHCRTEQDLLTLYRQIFTVWRGEKVASTRVLDDDE